MEREKRWKRVKSVAVAEIRIEVVRISRWPLRPTCPESLKRVRLFVVTTANDRLEPGSRQKSRHHAIRTRSDAGHRPLLCCLSWHWGHRIHSWFHGMSAKLRTKSLIPSSSARDMKNSICQMYDRRLHGCIWQAFATWSPWRTSHFKRLDFPPLWFPHRRRPGEAYLT